MKTRIFSICVCALLVASLFAGCNLFSTHNETYYNQIVAEVEGTDVKISKEQLLNSYYNYGSQLVQQGLTEKEAVEECVKQLINRDYMLKYLDAQAIAEVAAGVAEKDYRWELTNAEYNQAVKETWSYIDGELSTIAQELYGSAGGPADEEAKSPDFAPQAEYTPTFELLFNAENNAWEAYKYVDPDFVFESETKLAVKDYVKKEFANDEQTNTVFNKFIEDLKESQKERGQRVVGNAATLQRELDRAFKVNSENAYLNKFQTVATSNYGFDQNGKLNDSVVQEILNKYKEKYAANQEQANISPDTMGSAVVQVGARDSYVYYGNSENFFSVMHILVLFSDEQKAALSAIDTDIYLTDEERVKLKAEYKSVERTRVYLRDAEGFKTENSVTVEELDIILQDLYEEVKTENGGDTTTDKFAKDMAKRFNDLIYVYGEDTGMINPTYDYVIGTSSTGMVESFTEESRNLYNAGQRGAISSYVESEYGYHFIMYVNELNPIVMSANDIGIELLDSPMRLSGGATHLESLFAEVATDDFSGYQQRLISGLISGIKIVLYEDRYKDLFQ